MSFFSRARSAVSSAVRTVKRVHTQAKPVISAGTQVKKAYNTFTKARSSVKDAFDNARSVRTNGFANTWRSNISKTVSKATSAPSKLNLGGVAKKLGGAYSVVTGAAKVPRQVGTAISDVRSAIRSGSRGDWDRAVGSIATAGSNAVKTVKGGLELARDVHKLGSAYRAASTAFRSAAPLASSKVAGAAARSAAKLAFEGAGRQAIRNGVHTAASTVARNSGALRTAVGTGSRAAARATLRSGTTAAARAATTAAARSAAGPLARTAGRFAPGANVAIAAFDVAKAYSTVRDPNASTTKKVTSVITAVGSVAAATNIPVVSQVGAGVSAVSSFVGGLFG